MVSKAIGEKMKKKEPVGDSDSLEESLIAGLSGNFNSKYTGKIFEFDNIAIQQRNCLISRKCKKKYFQ